MVKKISLSTNNDSSVMHDDGIKPLHTILSNKTIVTK